MKNNGIYLLADLLLSYMAVFVGDLFLFFFPKIKSNSINPFHFIHTPVSIIAVNFFVLPLIANIDLPFKSEQNKKLFLSKNVHFLILCFGYIYRIFYSPKILRLHIFFLCWILFYLVYCFLNYSRVLV